MEQRKKLSNISGLLGWTGITLLSGFIVALGVTFFFLNHTLRSVPFPKNWWFPPFNIAYIWFSFYVVKGFSAWMVWKKSGSIIFGGIINWYVAHLIASIVATTLMFFLPIPLGFFAHSLVIAITFIATSWKFYQKHAAAGLILIPNMAWLLYILSYYGVTVFNTYQ